MCRINDLSCIDSIYTLQLAQDFRTINIYRWSGHDDWWATFLNNFSCWKGQSCRYWIQTVPNTSTKHFKGSDIPGTRIMRWLGKKKTPSRNNTGFLTARNASFWSSNSAHKKRMESRALEHHFKVAKSSLLDSFGHLEHQLGMVTFLRVWPAGCWVQGQVWPLCIYVYTYVSLAWLGRTIFAKQQDEKKTPTKVILTFRHSIRRYVFFWDNVSMLLSFHQLKLRPPLSKCRGSLLFLMGCCCNSLRMTTATPPGDRFLGNPGSLEGFIGCWKVVYLTFQRGGQKRTGKPIRLYAGWKPALNTEPKKKHDIYTLSLFWWGGKGATEKRNGTNQTQNRTAFCHHPPVDMDSVLSPTSPNVPPAFCECVTSQGELGGFSCKTTDIMRPSKNDDFL